ncbi:Squalene epoxidase [Niveomyces insectorum RCEF 264]|uniref:Squalene monooxygenase n=1 Tax=Niveomyces insectorum RCEF 264 TaxID=1081102 RepID=A0A167WWT1_9HYPO|nr:Squalene epoxidase [Niveomyces insectorum RCEF 264]
MSLDMADTAVDDRRHRRETHHEADVVIVGAGVFGCALAFALANQGRSVLLLERWLHEPNRIVGELMQPGGVAALRALGLGDCVENIDAIPCHGYHIVYDGDEIVIPYPALDDQGRVPMDAYVAAAANGGGSDKKHDGRPAPEGCSFHHGRFIMQLRRRCLAHPNITVVETEATGLICGGVDADEVLGVAAKTKVRQTAAATATAATTSSSTTTTTIPPTTEGADTAAHTKKPDCFFGQLTIVADGYDSHFRREVLGASHRPVVKSRFFALELIDCPLEPQGFGHVFIDPAAFPVLLYQIGTHETRALIDVPLDLPAARPAAGGVRGYIRHTVLPAMPAPRIPRLADHAAVAAALGRFHWSRKRLTAIINVLAQALYALFAADSRPLRTLQQGCFAYFRRGWAAQPMGLLGGLLQEPLVLAYHFFSVAFLAIWLHGVAVVRGSSGGGGDSGSSRGPFNALTGLVRLPLAVVDGLLVLWTACVVFLPVFWRELR